MATMKYSNLIKSGRVFHSIQEIDVELTKASRVALDNTLEDMKEKLHEIIEEDVYNNVHTTSNAHARDVFGKNYKYQSKWGGRTGSLLDNRTIETYIYNAFGKGVGGGIRLNDVAYDENTNLKSFQHGNKYFGELAFTSYIEMLNDSRRHLVENPYHFPTGNELYRRSFWADFRQWANFNYSKIYESYLRLALGKRVKIGKGDGSYSMTNPKSLPTPKTNDTPVRQSTGKARISYDDGRTWKEI